MKQREIKFRYQLRFGKNIETHIFSLRDIQNGCFENLGGVEIISISEYTGLKDKKGKEIYEGDIVKLFGGDKLERIDSVKWNKYEAKFSTSNAPSGSLFGGEQIEIIGNIYG